MKNSFVLIMLLTSCHIGPYVVHVKELPRKDGRAGYQLECPTAPHDCRTEAEKLCPGGHDVEPRGWPKPQIIRCRARTSGQRSPS